MIALIPQGNKHRIENFTDTKVIFKALKTSSYFGEDDIVRLEDRYNRINQDNQY
jgi:mannose-6-phosphate isomerase